MNTPLPLDQPSRGGVVHHSGVLSLPRMLRSPLLLPTLTHSGPLRGILRHDSATSSPFARVFWERRADAAEIAPHANSDREFGSSWPDNLPKLAGIRAPCGFGPHSGFPWSHKRPNSAGIPRPTRMRATFQPIWLSEGQFRPLPGPNSRMTRNWHRRVALGGWLAQVKATNTQ